MPVPITLSDLEIMESFLGAEMSSVLFFDSRGTMTGQDKNYILINFDTMQQCDRRTDRRTSADTSTVHASRSKENYASGLGFIDCLIARKVHYDSMWYIHSGLYHRLYSAQVYSSG